MVSKSAQGAWLIVGAFLVYGVLEALSVWVDAEIWWISIAGTVLLWLGARKILTAQAAAKGWMVAMVVLLLIGFLLGRVSHSMRDFQTLDQIRTFLAIVILQTLFFAAAAATVLWRNGSIAVRSLSVVAIACLGVYAWMVFGMLEGLWEGSLAYADFQAQYTAAAFLMTLMWLPALVFAVQSPKDAPPVPGKTGNPFGPGDAQPNAPRPMAGVTPRPMTPTPPKAPMQANTRAPSPGTPKAPVQATAPPPQTTSKAPAQTNPRPPLPGSQPTTIRSGTPTNRPPPPR
jgi:hypothetical protein